MEIDRLFGYKAKTQAKWKGKGEATTSGGWRRTETSKDVSTIPQGVQEAGPITRRVGLLLVKSYKYSSTIWGTRLDSWELILKRPERAKVP